MRFIRSFELRNLLKDPDFICALPRLPDGYTLPTPVQPSPQPSTPPPQPSTPPPQPPPSPLPPVSNKVFCFNFGTKFLHFSLPKFLPVYAIDSGSQVTGVAVSDFEGKAYPFTAIQMRSQRFGKASLIPVLKLLLNRINCHAFVIGYPRHKDEVTGNPVYSEHTEALMTTLDREPAFDDILCTEVDETSTSQNAPVTLVMDPGPIVIDAYNRKARKDMRAACGIMDIFLELSDNDFGPFSLYNKNKYGL